MNIQTGSLMPTREPQGLASSMNAMENRADSQAFSKELERRFDEAKLAKEPRPSPANAAGDRRIQNQGQKSVKSEGKQTSSVEKKEAKDPDVKSESGQGRLTKKAATSKQERLKKFMDSLESEFQVPPTRIVEAFSQLTPQELSLPADESISRVVENLNLDEESMAKVQSLYGDLVYDLDSIDASQLDSSSKAQLGSAAAALGLAQQRADTVKSQKMALQKSLDQMNQSFWQPQMVPVSAAVNPEALSTAVMAARERGGIESYRDLSHLQNYSDVMAMDDLGMVERPTDAFLDAAMDPRASDVIPTNANSNSMSANDAAGVGALGAAGLAAEADRTDKSAAMAMMDSRYEMERPKAAAMTANLNKTTGSAGSHSLSNVSHANPMDYSAAMLNKFGDSGNSFNGSSGGTTDFFSRGDTGGEKLKVNSAGKKVDGDEMKGMLASMGLGHQIKDNAMTETPAPLSKVDISPEAADRNIQNVMQQAQYLVKKGGGEMKVKMTPEGLGEIQLRVELKEGRVQLHMLAENKETKKMLESSVSDLKESLSHHKIALDSVKIDSVVRTNVDNQTQGNLFGQNQNQNQQQEQRETRQFWNQFQDQFGGRSQREALFEPPKPKSYATKPASNLGPADSTSATSGVASTAKSRGLNLVA